MPNAASPFPTNQKAALVTYTHSSQFHQTLFNIIVVVAFVPPHSKAFTEVKTEALNAFHWFVSQRFFLLGQTSQLGSLHETAKAASDKSTTNYPILGRHLCPSSIDVCRLLHNAHRPQCLLFAALSSSSRLASLPAGHLLHMSLSSSCTQNCSQPA